MSRDEAIDRIERELFLRSMSNTPVSKSQLDQMLGLLGDAVFGRGEAIYQRGKASERAYFIAEGRVELRAPNRATLVFEGPAGVGFLDGLMERPYSQDAVAVTDVRGFDMPMDEYFEFLEDNYDLCQAFILESCGELFDLLVALPDPAALFEPSGHGELHHDPARPFSLVERVLILSRVRPFAGVSTQALANLARVASESRFRAGEEIFRRGDESQRFWMIARGSVVIEHEDPDFRVSRGVGELVESYAAFGSETRKLSATAETDVILLHIDQEDLFDRMEEHFDLTRALFRFVAYERQKLNEAAAVESADEAARELAASQASPLSGPVEPLAG